jgi:hypothetical protein
VFYDVEARSIIAREHAELLRAQASEPRCEAAAHRLSRRLRGIAAGRIRPTAHRRPLRGIAG